MSGGQRVGSLPGAAFPKGGRKYCPNCKAPNDSGAVQCATCRIDGREVLLQEISIGKEITALTDNLIVRVDRKIEVNHLQPHRNFLFGVKLSRRTLQLGQRVQIRIRPKESSIAPLVRLYLPGCLALLKGGANAQTAHLAVGEEELTVDAVAVRPGHGKLYATVHDMYDADKIGTVPGIQIRVKG